MTVAQGTEVAALITAFPIAFDGLPKTGKQWLGLLELFVIVLDQKIIAMPEVSKQALLDSGYSEEVASRIVEDTQFANSQLKQEAKPLVFEDNASPEEIQPILKTEFPSASDDFIKFFAKRIAFIAQANQPTK